MIVKCITRLVVQVQSKLQTIWIENDDDLPLPLQEINKLIIFQPQSHIFVNFFTNVYSLPAQF